VGQVSLVYASTGDMSARVGVGQAPADLAVTQSGGDALVVDRSTGSVTRVDGASERALPGPVRPLPDAARGLSVFAGPGVAYAVDTAKGAVVTLDPDSMRFRGQAMSFAVSADPTAGVTVDPSGRLWALDTRTGDLLRLTGTVQRT